MKVKENDCIYCEKRGNYGLMICCERCESWYHFKCVNKKWDLNLPRSQLHYLADYYCYPCRRANPSLKLKYYSSNNFNSSDYNKKTATKPIRTSRKDQATTTTNNIDSTNGLARTNPVRVPSPSSSSSCRYIFSSSSSSSSSSTSSSSRSSSSSPSSCSTIDSSSLRTSSPSSSSSKSDEAIENKKPTITTSSATATTTTKPTSSNSSRLNTTNCGCSSSANNHQNILSHDFLHEFLNKSSYQIQEKQTQEKDNQEKFVKSTVGKIPIKHKRAIKNNTSPSTGTGSGTKLRSNQEKATRRQPHSSSKNYNG